MNPILESAIAGAAGGFVAKITEKSVEWLSQLFGSHSAEVKQATNANFGKFINRLAKRIERLEAELPETKRRVFEDALSHPSTSLLIQRAMVSAAITDNDDRHEILSELIAQRLTAGADDMIALAGSAACDIVNSLASKHIKFLGLAARVFAIRPTEIAETTDQNHYDELIVQWWAPLGEFLREPLGIKVIDMWHLIGLSCIHWYAIGKTLEEVLSISARPRQLKPTRSVIEAQPWWLNFHDLWGTGLKAISLTSTGRLIGILYHDSILRVKTTIAW